MSYDVIIIGAGIMGSSTAFQLSEMGKKCLLIDRFPLQHTFGSSHGDSRIIRRSYPESHFAKLMISAYDLWHDLEERYKEQFIVTTGGLDFGQEKSPEMKKVVDTVKQLQLKYVILNNKEIMEKFPAFRLSDDSYGLYQPDAGIVLASKALNFFQTISQKKGLEVLTGEKVSLIKEEGDQLMVSTKSKSFKAKKVVICAGSWINDFFKNYRIAHRTKVLPVNYGYWKIKNANHFEVNNFPIFISWSENTFYGFPSLERKNYFKMGAHYSSQELDFRSEDTTKNIISELVTDMVSFIGKTFPDVDLDNYEIDSCYYTMNENENFILDFHPDNSNIVFGGGFSGHGFKFAPLIGKILSELAIKERTNFEISEFRLSNFSKN